MTCICREPKCSGCDCGAECSFAPGHEDGTNAETPIEALIEAAEGILDAMEDRGETINESEDRLDYDVRRLYATIGWVKREQEKREQKIQNINNALDILSKWDVHHDIFGGCAGVVMDALVEYKESLEDQIVS